jgi:hypothetical protein
LSSNFPPKKTKTNISYLFSIFVKKNKHFQDFSKSFKKRLFFSTCLKKAKRWKKKSVRFLKKLAILLFLKNGKCDETKKLVFCHPLFWKTAVFSLQSTAAHGVVQRVKQPRGFAAAGPKTRPRARPGLGGRRCGRMARRRPPTQRGTPLSGYLRLRPAAAAAAPGSRQFWSPGARRALRRRASVKEIITRRFPGHTKKKSLDYAVETQRILMLLKKWGNCVFDEKSILGKISPNKIKKIKKKRIKPICKQRNILFLNYVFGGRGEGEIYKKMKNGNTCFCF